MIKSKGTSADGRPFLIFGLSRINTERLLQGDPIPIDTEALGLPGGPHILIMAGETEEDILNTLRQHVTLPEPQPEPSDGTKH